MIRLLHLLILSIAMLGFTGQVVQADEALPEVEIVEIADLSQLSTLAKAESKLIMLEISASYCDFCRKLEENIIKPMLRSGDYEDNVLIRRFEIDSFSALKDFDGLPVSNDELTRRWDIQVTPTLIFLNSNYQEVSDRIIGVNSLDYLGSYVDNAIDNGLAAIR